MILKHFERTVKDFGFRAITRLAPDRRKSPTIGDLAEVRKLLVIRLDDRIGNVVLTTSLMQALRHTFPQAEIHALISIRCRGLAPYLPGLNRVWYYEKAVYARKPWCLARLLRVLANEKYDLVFDASDERELSFNHAITTALTGGAFRIGYDRRGSAAWLEKPVPPGISDRHATEMLVDLLRAVKSVSEAPHPKLILRNVNAFGIRFREQHDIAPGTAMIVIHPGGSGAKRWPFSRFLELATKLHERGHIQPVMIWGPKEDRLVASAERGIPSSLILAGQLTFADVISLLCEAQVYISNDNGIMHLANACGVPTVGIFTVSNLNKYRPRGVYDRAFDDSGGTIAPDQIVMAVEEILDATGSRRPEMRQ